MKIAIDTRMEKRGGIGTYLSHLLPYLQKSSCEVKKVDCKAKIYSLREQVELPWKISACDLFWSPHFNAPILPIQAQIKGVTIHDLYHLDHLASLSLAKWIYVKTILNAVIKRADFLITVSEFSKSRLLHYFPEIDKKITVIPLGCDHLMEVEPHAVNQLRSPFFLCVGNNKPHKNRAVLFKALLMREQMQLVVVGAEKPNNPELSGKIHFLNNISKQELSWLYKNAEALIFPSLYEGWGLPPLEAMQLGCPVIASNAASIPEVCGNAALYFNPKDEEELCARIEQLSKVRLDLISAGKKQASQFTWKRSADEHLQLFKSACLR